MHAGTRRIVDGRRHLVVLLEAQPRTASRDWISLGNNLYSQRQRQHNVETDR